MDSSSASPVTVEEASKALADAQAVLVEVWLRLSNGFEPENRHGGQPQR